VSAQAASRILVIKLSALGDVIQALGPMAAIRRHHAGAHIVVLTTKPYEAILQASPYADEIWVDERPTLLDVPGWLSLRRRLRRGRFDRVYDLQTSDRSGFYYRLLGPGRRPQWSGIAPGCSHPHANPRRDAMHIVDSQAEQLRMAGIADVPPSDVSWLTADIARYGLPKPYVLMVPGGSPHRPQKIWPAERFGSLARQLVKRGYTPALIGTPPERPLADLVRGMCHEARSLIGKTSFADLAALGREAAAAVGGVTGPMHLIAVAGAPSLVMFSAISDPEQCGPRGRKAVYLRKDDLADLPVDEVSAALNGLLAKPV
jgi:ADP-heptose:LPS heptosyltransferase